MRNGQANIDREFPYVVGKLCLENISTSPAKFQKFTELYDKQGSTELSGSVVIFGKPTEVYTQWITAGTATSYDTLHNYIKSVDLLTKSTQVEDNLATVLESLLGSLDRPYTKNLVERLEFLAEPSEDLREPKLSLGSLKQFVSFIKSRRFQQPELVLSVNGNIRAEWRQDRAHHFAVEFLPDGFVKFVAFIESQINANKIERISGTPSLGKLRAIMAITGAKWCFE